MHLFQDTQKFNRKITTSLIKNTSQILKVTNRLRSCIIYKIMQIYNVSSSYFKTATKQQGSTAVDMLTTTMTN